MVALAPVPAAGDRPVLAGQAVELVLGFMRPEAGQVAGPLVLGDPLVVGLEVVGHHVPLEVGGGDDKADLAVAEVMAVGGDAVGFVLGLVPQFGDPIPRLGPELQAGIVEGRAGDDVDIARHGLARHVRRHGLGHDDLGGDGRRHGVEPGVAAFGADDVDPVEAQSRPVVGRAAEADIAGLALVALHRHAGQAAGGLGDVLVRQATDAVRGGDRHQGVRGLLGAQGRSFGFRNRPGGGDDDLADGAGVLGPGGEGREKGGGADQRMTKRRRAGGEGHRKHPVGWGALYGAIRPPDAQAS